MTSSDPCEVCLMTGMMCRHRKTDLNHSMALFSDDGRNSNGPQEFQFFGIGGGSDSWLVDGPSYTMSGLPEVTVVAERGFKYTDFLRNNCDPSRLSFDVSLSSSNTSSTTTTTASTVSSLRSPDVIGKTALTSMISLSSVNTPTEADEVTLPAGGDTVDMDREARVLRYREKKKRRKFEKQIRYASRKAYAEMRPRVRGRFAKIPDISQPPAIPPAYNSGQYDMGWYQP